MFFRTLQDLLFAMIPCKVSKEIKYLIGAQQGNDFIDRFNTSLNSMLELESDRRLQINSVEILGLPLCVILLRHSD